MVTDVGPSDTVSRPVMVVRKLFRGSTSTSTCLEVLRFFSTFKNARGSANLEVFFLGLAGSADVGAGLLVVEEVEVVVVVVNETPKRLAVLFFLFLFLFPIPKSTALCGGGRRACTSSGGDGGNGGGGDGGGAAGDGDRIFSRDEDAPRRSFV